MRKASPHLHQKRHKAKHTGGGKCVTVPSRNDLLAPPLEAYYTPGPTMKPETLLYLAALAAASVACCVMLSVSDWL